MDAGQIGILMMLTGAALLIAATSNHQRRMNKKSKGKSLKERRGYRITWHNSK